MRIRICEAIRNKQLIQFRYDGLIRIVEPHLLGETTAGNDALSAYLVRGYTESDRRPYWRLYKLDEMSAIVILDETFEGPRKGYNSNDTRMTRIHCRLMPS
jgi:predicted DNA-binding transcriptional regulator YafY